MSTQTFANHRQLVTGYHFVISFLALVSLLASWANVYRALQRGNGRLEAMLIAVMVVTITMLFWYVRVFPLKAQDRAIRAEENLRHFAMTGALLDPRLTIRQVIGLRFASDEEFVDLAKRAAEEGLSENAIKKAVNNWRGDEYRV